MKAKTTQAVAKKPASKRVAKATGRTAAQAATAGGSRSSGKASSSVQDAVALLKADHRAVEQMFVRYASSDDADDKSELVRAIGNALVIHARLEEEIFYPACRQGGIEDALMDEAQVEHDTLALFIRELVEERPDAPFHDAKVKVLGEYVNLHVREEEKPSSGIFAKAAASGLDMAVLGERLAARKQELELQADADGVILPSPRTLGTQCYSDHGDMNMARYNQERDEQGRFVSDDDRRYSSQGRQDDERRYGRSRDDDDRGSRGRDDDRGGRYSRSRYDDDRGSASRARDDDDRGGARGGHGGWFGDPEGHSRASERGWEGRRNDDDERGGRYSRSRYDDDRGGSSRSRYDDDRGGSSRGGHGGWFGDPEGHARAAERGWENRRDDDDDRGRYSRSRYDDDRGGSSRSRYDDDRGGGGRGGWFGDPEGHARAAERGWETRRDDDDDRGRRGGSRGR